MPLLVPEPPIFRCGLVAAELGANGSVDQFGQVVRDFDIRAKTEEYVSGLTGLVFLAPDPAVAEIRNRAYAVIERNSLLAVGLHTRALARCFANFDVGQWQVVAIEQLGDFGGGGQRLVFGAAVIDGLGAQCMDARLELVERGEIRLFVHGCVTRKRSDLLTLVPTPASGPTLRHGSGPRRRRKARQVATLCPQANILNPAADRQFCRHKPAMFVELGGTDQLARRREARRWPSGKMPFAFRWNVHCNRIYFVMLPALDVRVRATAKGVTRAGFVPRLSLRGT